MKLIYIANARIPTEKAHGIQIFKTCESFIKAGVNLELWIPKRRNPLNYFDPFEYYGIKDKFSIVRFNCLDLIGRLDFLPGAGYWIQSKTFAWSVAKRLENLSSDTIAYSRDIIPLEPIRRKGISYFYEAHTVPKNPSAFQKKIFKGAAGIVTISRELAKEFTKHVSKDKIFVAPDAVEIEKFSTTLSKEEARKKLNLPQDKKIVMYTGHLYDWKGAGTLLEAARNTYKLQPTSYNLLYVFVGGTDYDLKKFKERAKGLDNVLILGHKPHEQIPLYLAAADVLVLPNSAKEKISSHYTSPLKLFEYMAAGRPIVASDLLSIRDILDESTAVLAKPDDPEDFTSKILDLLDDPNLARTISEQAFRKVKQHSWTSRAQLILSFISRE